jgi:hypothetical protein
VDDSVAKDFFQGYSAADSKEYEFFIPPSSLSSPSEILGVNDRAKLLQEFLTENSARSIVGVPRLETLIRAKWMLELYHEIVHQLESLKSGVDSAGRASRRSGRSSCCVQIRAALETHLLGAEKSSRPYRWNGGARRWDHIPLDVHVGYGADPCHVFHFPVFQIFTSVASSFASSVFSLCSLVALMMDFCECSLLAIKFQN